MGLLREHCYLSRYLYKLGLVKSKSVTDANRHLSWPYVFSDCETMATLRYRNLGQYVMKPDDQEEIPVSWILPFVQGVGLINTLHAISKFNLP